MRVKWSQRWSRAACCSSAGERPGTVVLTSGSFRLAAPLEEDVREHQEYGDQEDRRADDVDLRRHGDARRAPDEEREGLLGPGDEVRDDEVVDGEREGEQGRGQDAGRDER